MTSEPPGVAVAKRDIKKYLESFRRGGRVDDRDRRSLYAFVHHHHLEGFVFETAAELVRDCRSWLKLQHLIINRLMDLFQAVARASKTFEDKELTRPVREAILRQADHLGGFPVEGTYYDYPGDPKDKEAFEHWIRENDHLTSIKTILYAFGVEFTEQGVLETTEMKRGGLFGLGKLKPHPVKKRWLVTRDPRRIEHDLRHG